MESQVGDGVLVVSLNNITETPSDIMMASHMNQESIKNPFKPACLGDHNILKFQPCHARSHSFPKHGDNRISSETISSRMSAPTTPTDCRFHLCAALRRFLRGQPEKPRRNSDR